MQEFIEEAVKEGFDPQLGLFAATTDQQLYPNPHARAVRPSAAATAPPLRCCYPRPALPLLLAAEGRALNPAALGRRAWGPGRHPTWGPGLCGGGSLLSLARLKTASPNAALPCPAPCAPQLAPNALRLIEFLGKVVGKAMAEGEAKGARWAGPPARWC